jgi:hypothetical protein
MSRRIGPRSELMLPEGERLLWQGQPTLRAMLVRVFHIRLVAAYFGVLFAAGLISGALDHQPFLASLAGGTPLLIPAGLSMLLRLAWLYSRTTRYSITSRRVLLQFGAVLPMTLNVPFAQIARADLRICGDGSGELPLGVTSEQRLSYLLLWPHVRPWRLNRVEPMLRGVPDAQAVADILAQALRAASPRAAQDQVAQPDSASAKQSAPAIASAA